jgi:lipid II:glycine glycyltransferase (peptidoglycan interpeptide bridge formation enzyme)
MPPPPIHVHKYTLNNIQITQHNKTIWHVHMLLLSNSTTRDILLMNVGTYSGSPQEYNPYMASMILYYKTMLMPRHTET